MKDLWDPPWWCKGAWRGGPGSGITLVKQHERMYTRLPFVDRAAERMELALMFFKETGCTIGGFGQFKRSASSEAGRAGGCFDLSTSRTVANV